MSGYQILHDCPECLIEGVLVEEHRTETEKPTFVCSFCGYEKKQALVKM